jgi:hypothetical protein
VPLAYSRRRQRGQALIYGMFVLIGGLAALFFFFNTGQITREKTKLVNTADAVAYSAGLMQARALNFTAYGNRALIANEVLVAQMVSLSSWSKYIGKWSDNLASVHYECELMARLLESGDYYSAAVGAAAAAFKFGPDYSAACTLLATDYIANVIEPVVDQIPAAADVVVSAVELNKTIVKAAQDVVNNPTVFAAERHSVMQSVANANYAGDGSVNVAVNVLAPDLTDDWFRGDGGAFVHQYKDDERTRFKEVAVAAAHSDGFVKQRSWTSRAVLPEPSCLAIGSIVFNEVRRRGGTEMLGLDEWQAVDTQSYHERYLRKLRCRRREVETGYGEQQAYKDDQSPGTSSFGRSREDNQNAHSTALSSSSDEFTQYSGLPNYYDLNAVWISGANREEAPTVKHSVRITRAKGELRTTDGGNGQIRTRADSRIGAYDSALAGNEMAAISTSEVFFERPAGQADNIFGRSIGKPRELGSLFNPYWQVRLVGSSVANQWTLKGVGAPFN